MIASLLLGIVLGMPPAASAKQPAAFVLFHDDPRWEQALTMTQEELLELQAQLLQEIADLNAQIKQLLLEIKHLQKLIRSGQAEHADFVRLDECQCELQELRDEKRELRRLLRFVESLLDS